MPQACAAFQLPVLFTTVLYTPFPSVSIRPEVVKSASKIAVSNPKFDSTPATVVAPVPPEDIGKAVDNVKVFAETAANVEAPVTVKVSERVVAPVTPKVFVILVVAAVSPARVDAPVTPRVPVIVAFVPTAKVLVKLVAPAVKPARVVAPVTSKVPPTEALLLSVATPVTPKVPPTVAASCKVVTPTTPRVLDILVAAALKPASVEAPATFKVFPRLVAPVASKVPAIAVFPLAEATVNLFVFIFKSAAKFVIPATVKVLERVAAPVDVKVPPIVALLLAAIVVTSVLPNITLPAFPLNTSEVLVESAINVNFAALLS